MHCIMNVVIIERYFKVCVWRMCTASKYHWVNFDGGINWWTSTKNNMSFVISTARGRSTLHIRRIKMLYIFLTIYCTSRERHNYVQCNLFNSTIHISDSNMVHRVVTWCIYRVSRFRVHYCSYSSPSEHLRASTAHESIKND